MRETRKPTGGILFWVLVFIAVLTPRLVLIRDHGFAHPYWDQWHSEGVTLIRPWLEGHFKVSDLFAPNSEHRITLTRILQLGLLVVGRQWDGLTQVVANSLLYSFLATWFLAAVARSADTSLARLASVLFAVVFMLPLGWANTLWGFQSQFYFLIFLSLYAIVQTSNSLPLSSGWWLAYLAAFASFLGMAGGVLTPVVCCILQLLRAWCARDRGKAVWIASAAWLGLATGLFFWTPVVSGSTVRAATLADFGTTLFKNLAFPFINPWFAIPVTLSALGAFISFLRPRNSSNLTPLDFTLFGCLMWSMGQAVAIAYSRGAGGPAPTHRYFDVLALLVPATIGLLWRLPAINRFEGKLRWAIVACATCLLAASAVRLISLTQETCRFWLPQHNVDFERQEKNLQTIIKKNDYDAFAVKAAGETSSYLPPAVMKELLSSPEIGHALAPSIRKPLLNGSGAISADDPSDIATARSYFDEGKFKGLRIISFNLDHPPSYRLIWRALFKGIFLIRGPQSVDSTQCSLITWHPSSEDAQLQGLLTDFGARQISLFRSISVVGTGARILLTWHLFLSCFLAMLAVSVMFYSRPSQRIPQSK